MKRKTVYIAGPITGVPEYYKPFEQAMDELQAAGFIPLNPCWQPEGLERWQYMKLGLSMLECADAALFLPGWEKSEGCKLEMAYCKNTGKPYAPCEDLERLGFPCLWLKFYFDEHDPDRRARVKARQLREAEPKAPEGYNGKLVCTRSIYSWWTVGKVYSVVNGRIIDDNGSVYPDRNLDPYADAKDARHAGNQGFPDPRHNPMNEFMPLAEG